MPFATSLFPLIGNLIGLPHSAAKGLGTVGGSTYLEDYCSSIAFATGPMVVVGGSVLLYVVTATEPGRFTDGIDPNSTLDQSFYIGAATTANLVQRIGNANQLLPNTQYQFNGFGITAILGTKPPLWAPLIENLSGGPLSVAVAPYGSHTVQT